MYKMGGRINGTLRYMYVHVCTHTQQFSGANPERLVAAIKYFLQGKGAEKGLRWEEGRKDGGEGEREGGREGGWEEGDGRRGKGWRGMGGGEKNEGRVGEGGREGGSMNVIASHEYIEHVHSGEEEVKERTIGRRSAAWGGGEGWC